MENRNIIQQLKYLAAKIREENKTVEKSLKTLRDAGILDAEGNFTEFYNLKTTDMLFTKKQEKKEIVHQFFAPPPPPKEVAKIQTMLRQVETWINACETELAEKHWILISEECRKYGT